DQYMINCLRYYLKNGLVGFNHKSLERRKIINNTDKLFLDWIESGERYEVNKRIIKKDFFFKFKKDNEPDFDKMKTTHIFTKWLKSYSEYKGYDYVENSSNGERWFEFQYENKNPDITEYLENNEEDPF